MHHSTATNLEIVLPISERRTEKMLQARVNKYKRRKKAKILYFLVHFGTLGDVAGFKYE